jgi:hypothetical protein
MLQPPPTHVKRQLPVLLLLQVRMQPPPGQSYSQLPTVLHVQLEPALQVPLKLPTVVELLQPEAAAPAPTRHASSSPFDLPNVMASSGSE